MLTMDTPIALFIFNRPDTTQKVFSAIRDSKPTKLLIVADGPRPERPEEEEICTATRAIVNQVDWPCEVLTNFADHNLGCKARISSGLNWVFETVEEAIILEDDCVPSLSFFPFCEQLLEQYRHDSRIMSISGSNFQFGKNKTSYSYHFSHFFHGWGWASWQRAWEHCDLNLGLWPKI